MADRPDENKKELSIEELTAWNVEKLQKYLKNRGVVITSDTRKRDLVSNVYHARSIFFRLLSPPRFSNIPLSGCFQHKLQHHRFYL